MSVRFGPAGAVAVYALKAAFHAFGPPNTGKTLSTLESCAENGGKYAAQGALPFVQLNRF